MGEKEFNDFLALVKEVFRNQERPKFFVSLTFRTSVERCLSACVFLKNAVDAKAVEVCTEFPVSDGDLGLRTIYVNFLPVNDADKGRPIRMYMVYHTLDRKTRKEWFCNTEKLVPPYTGSEFNDLKAKIEAVKRRQGGTAAAPAAAPLAPMALMNTFHMQDGWRPGNVYDKWSKLAGFGLVITDECKAAEEVPPVESGWIIQDGGWEIGMRPPGAGRSVMLTDVSSGIHMFLYRSLYAGGAGDVDYVPVTEVLDENHRKALCLCGYKKVSNGGRVYYKGVTATTPVRIMSRYDDDAFSDDDMGGVVPPPPPPQRQRVDAGTAPVGHISGDLYDDPHSWFRDHMVFYDTVPDPEATKETDTGGTAPPCFGNWMMVMSSDRLAECMGCVALFDTDDEYSRVIGLYRSSSTGVTVPDYVDADTVTTDAEGTLLRVCGYVKVLRGGKVYYKGTAYGDHTCSSAIDAHRSVGKISGGIHDSTPFANMRLYINVPEPAAIEEKYPDEDAVARGVWMTVTDRDELAECMHCVAFIDTVDEDTPVIGLYRSSFIAGVTVRDYVKADTITTDAERALFRLCKYVKVIRDGEVYYKGTAYGNHRCPAAIDVDGFDFDTEEAAAAAAHHQQVIGKISGDIHDPDRFRNMVFYIHVPDVDEATKETDADGAVACFGDWAEVIDKDGLAECMGCVALFGTDDPGTPVIGLFRSSSIGVPVTDYVDARAVTTPAEDVLLRVCGYVKVTRGDKVYYKGIAYGDNTCSAAEVEAERFNTEGDGVAGMSELDDWLQPVG